MSFSHQPPQPGPQPSPLTQAERDRCERNRLAALERRRQALLRNGGPAPPAEAYPPAEQPQPPVAPQPPIAAPRLREIFAEAPLPHAALPGRWAGFQHPQGPVPAPLQQQWQQWQQWQPPPVQQQWPQQPPALAAQLQQPATSAASAWAQSLYSGPAPGQPRGFTFSAPALSAAASWPPPAPPAPNPLLPSHPPAPAADPPPVKPKLHRGAGVKAKAKIKSKEEGAYGAGTSFAFDPTPAPRRTLQQATLGETMGRWRASKAQAAAAAAAGGAAAAVDSAGGEESCGDEGPGEGEGTGSWLSSETTHPPPALGPSAVAAPLAAPPGDSPSPAPGAAPPPAARKRMQAALCGPDDAGAADDGQRWGWLARRRDAAGRAPDHPAYDPRTLLIPAPDLARLRGFNLQYWSIKKHCMDVVLFVRVGSFYELYDADADVGLRCGLNPMGRRAANMWRVGCAAAALPQWAARVLALGLALGRVEEVRRGRRAPEDGALVMRRLENFWTPGTALLEGPLGGGGGGGGGAGGAGGDEGAPSRLVALVEGANGLLAACVADVGSATLRVGQWQEGDAARSMLRTLLVRVNPAEIVAQGPGALTLDTLAALKAHRSLVADGLERALALTWLRPGGAGAPHHDPDAAAQVPDLLRAAEAAWFAARGAAAPFAAAAPALSAMPHAAAALHLAVAHLEAAGAARRLLPAATLAPLQHEFTAAGAAAAGRMLLDSTALRCLEVVEGSLGGPAGSLLGFLSAGARTPGGRRRLRDWVCAPLYRVGDIEERLDAVAALMQLPEGAGAFQAALGRAPDCERLLPRAAGVLEEVVEAAEAQAPSQPEGGAGAQGDGTEEEAQGAGGGGDLSQGRFLPVVQLLEGLGIMLEAVTALDAALAARRPAAAAAAAGGGGLPHLVRALTRGARVAEALSSLQRVFHAGRFAAAGEDLALEPGLSEAYDEAAAGMAAARRALAGVVSAEQARLLAAGGDSGTVRRVRLVGGAEDVLLEVPAALKGRTPPGNRPVKETKTLARYRLPAAAAAAAALEAARDTARDAVLAHLCASARLFLDTYPSFLEFAAAVSALDALASLAEATHPSAAPPGCAFSRPVFTAPVDGAAPGAPPAELRLQGLWSPQLLLAQGGAGRRVQPNDLVLGGGHPTTMLLTGANTGGKSTLLRSACLAVIMAQLGCYVPCAAAVLTPADRVFTRLGAHDRIDAGESTFLVEMTETSAVLRHAGPASLVILDELGRGTSTHDGYALAAAVTAFLTSRPRCRLLFATHYHGLTQERELVGDGSVGLAHMASSVGPRGLEPRFLLRPGPAPAGSCGVHVAAAAGLPRALVARAAEMAGRMEAEMERAQRARRAALRGPPASPPPARTALAGTQAAFRSENYEDDDASDDEEGEVLALGRDVAAALEAAGAGAPGAGRRLQALQAAVTARLWQR